MPDAGLRLATSIGVDTTVPFSVSRAIPADGSWTLKVVATDNALNTTSDIETVSIDRTRPQTTVDSSPASITNQTGATFTFSSNDGGATFEVRLDGGAWIPSTSPKVYSGLSDGPHTFEVRATDAAGNVDLSPATFAWTVDTAAPNTTITGNPASPTNAAGATFSFTSSEGSSTFECRLEGGSVGLMHDAGLLRLARRGRTHLRGARDRRRGEHGRDACDLQLVDRPHQPDRLDDLAGQRLARPAQRSCSRATRQTAVPASCRSSSSARPPAQVPGLRRPRAGTRHCVSDGDYDLRVVTSDAAGNVTVSGVITVTVDNTPPNTSITSQPADPTSATGASFGFSSEAGASYEVRLDSGAWIPSASPKSYSGLAEGSHTFEVRATDLTGNVDATPATYTWTVDTTAPNTNITSQPVDPTNATGASFAFTSTEVARASRFGSTAAPGARVPARRSTPA